ncbi:hypothetical protein [Coleofasciculus sp. FACHB-T130]|uniref:hypothetical protein n=1 Tax=Cyanophyceae TaxID=3028117 RepID=UPI001687ECE6|nr:hypothetical protein [Coleofasciculus sp. FACHB-T130]MBD1878361.1 hypothetical protein [Coleofasciculus sp. FACHB-T130]
MALSDPDSKTRYAQLINLLQGDLKTAAFARRLGLSRTAVNQWKSQDVKSVEAENLAKVAAFSGRSLNDIYAYLRGDLNLEEYLNGTGKRSLTLGQILQEVSYLARDEAAQVAIAAIEAMREEGRASTYSTKGHPMTNKGNLIELVRAEIDSRTKEGFLRDTGLTETELNSLLKGETPNPIVIGFLTRVLPFTTDQLVEMVGNNYPQKEIPPERHHIGELNGINNGH